MTDGEIEIRINKRMMERLAYWVLICILAVLLIISYVGKDDCTADTVVVEVVEETAVVENETEPENLLPEIEPETCDDDIMNQDETDVDCGGLLCDACAEGEDCELNTDCEDDLCEDGVCGVSIELSGERDVKITGVEYVENEGTSAAKVTEVRFTVENGMDTVLNARIEIWIKTDDGLFYLGQPEDNIENGVNPYGEYSLSPIPVGATKSYTLDRDGDVFNSGYLFSLPFGAYYGGGDDFIVEVKLIGKSGEGIMDTATYTVTV